MSCKGSLPRDDQGRYGEIRALEDSSQSGTRESPRNEVMGFSSTFPGTKQGRSIPYVG